MDRKNVNTAVELKGLRWIIRVFRLQGFRNECGSWIDWAEVKHCGIIWSESTRNIFNNMIFKKLNMLSALLSLFINDIFANVTSN